MLVYSLTGIKWSIFVSIKVEYAPILTGNNVNPVITFLDQIETDMKSLGSEIFPIIISTISDGLVDYIGNSKIKFKALLPMASGLRINFPDLKFTFILEDRHGNEHHGIITIRLSETDKLKDFKRKLALSLLNYLSGKGNEFMFSVNNGKYKGSIGKLDGNKLSLGFHKLSYKIISIPMPSKKNITHVYGDNVEQKIVVTNTSERVFVDTYGNEINIGDLVLIGDWYMSMAVIIDVDPVTNQLIGQSEHFSDKRLIEPKSSILNLEYVNVKEIKNRILFEKLSSG